jgi:hypothetical protein
VVSIYSHHMMVGTIAAIMNDHRLNDRCCLVLSLCICVCFYTCMCAFSRACFIIGLWAVE